MKWPHRHPCCCFLLLGSSSSSFNLNHHHHHLNQQQLRSLSSSSSSRGRLGAAAGASILRKNNSSGASGSTSSSPAAKTTTSTSTVISTTTTGAAATSTHLPLLFTMNPNHHPLQQPQMMEGVNYIAAAAADAVSRGGDNNLQSGSSGSNSSSGNVAVNNYDDTTGKEIFMGEGGAGEGSEVMAEQSSSSSSSSSPPTRLVLDGGLTSDDFIIGATNGDGTNGNEEDQQELETNKVEEEDTLMMINGGKGPCKSIEEASVNTTIESLTIAEEEEEEEDLMKLTPVSRSVVDEEGRGSVGGTVVATSTDTTAAAAAATSASPIQAQHEHHHHNVKLRLTPEEENLFNLLTQAAEQYESGMLSLDPIIPPTEGEDVVENIKFGGGFTAEQRKQLMQQQQSQEGTSIDGIEEGATTDDINGNALQQQQLSPTQRRQFIEIRIAGGWVRDKLLNQHSVDVDVALDCMMGVQFAKIVQRYMMMTMTSTSLPSPLSSPTMSSSFASSSFDTTMETTDKSSTTNSEKRRQPTKQPKKNQPRKQPKIGVIGANPSQSKHLETATMNVHGMDVDFVNLRAEEVYELDSRIPTSKTRMFGTPLEDALRRDFTINSLFYNIRTHKIEDWTGRGLDDLFQYRRIVTPVDPHMTFHDDPLRVLRAIRFAVRLNFTLDETIKEAAMSHRVHHSLHAKVSRERVGKEVEGMLSGKHARPGCALNMIAELHLAGSVFAFPGSFPGDHGYYVGGGKVSGHILGVEYDCSLGAVAAAAAAAATTGEKVCIQEAIAVAAKHRARGWEESSSLLNVLPPLIEGHADEREKIVAARGGDVKLTSTVLDKRLLHLCVFILPFHNLTFPDRKGRLVPVTTHMVKEALKFSNQDIQAVTKILSHVDEMVTILTEIRSQMAAARLTPEEEHDDSPIQVGRPCRLRIGLLLRSLKEHWVTCLITAAAWEVRTYQRLHENDADGNVPTASISMEEPSRELYRVIIETLALDECWKAQPHFNGQQVIKELSLPTGPLVGVFLDDQIRWMLLNPSGTKEQCLAHLQQRRREREEECIDQSMHGDAVTGGGMGKDSGAMHPSKKSREK